MRRLFLAVTLVFFLLLPAMVLAQGPPTISDMKVWVAQRATGWSGPPREPGSTEWRTEFWVYNLSDREIVIQVAFLDQSTKPVPLTILGSNGRGGVGHLMGFNLFPRENRTYTLSACSPCGTESGTESLITGPMVFTGPATWSNATQKYELDYIVSVIYKQLDANGIEQTAVGVNAGSLVSKLVFPVTITSNTDAGFALYNPSTETAKLTLELYNLYSFDSRPIATTTLTLQPGQQLSKFVSELFPSLTNDQNGNKVSDGNLAVTSDRPIAATAVKAYFYPGVFRIAGIPIIPR